MKGCFGSLFFGLFTATVAVSGGYAGFVEIDATQYP